MELPRLAHDAVLQHLDEPREEQLYHEVAQLGHHARILSDDVDDDDSDDDEGEDKNKNKKKKKKKGLPVAEVAVPVAPSDAAAGPTKPAHGSGGAGETTPLLMAGKHVVAVDSDVDLKALALRLNEEERAAVQADARAAPLAIVKEESKVLVALAIPMMLAAVLEFLPDTVLTMMIGRVSGEYSTQILAAFSLSGLFQMLLVAGLMNGLGSAIDTMCSQAFGGKRHVELWMFTQAGLIMYLCCVPFVAAMLLNGAPILKALGQDAAIADVAATLLLINLLSLPFSLLFAVLKSALQAQNIVAPFVKTSVISWAVSLPIAYVLGYWTPLGYMGIALSQVLNNAVKALALVPVVLKNAVFVDAWPGWQWREALKLVPKISRLGVSSVLMVTFQMAGFSVISLLAGLLPNADIMISANSIFGSVLILSFLPLLGICIAGAIRTGNALGAGQAKRARLIVRVVIASSLTVSAAGVVLGLLLAGPFSRSFTTNAEAIRVATTLIHNLLPMVPLMGLVFGLQSVFRACGKQWLCAQFNFVFMFLIGIPLGVWFAIQLDLGILGLWYGHFTGAALFITSGLVWVFRLDWERMAHEARRNTHLHVETPEASEVPAAAVATAAPAADAPRAATAAAY